MNQARMHSHMKICLGQMHRGYEPISEYRGACLEEAQLFTLDKSVKLLLPTLVVKGIV